MIVNRRDQWKNVQINTYIIILCICLFVLNANKLYAQKKNSNKNSKDATYSIYLPKGYTSTKTYPLVVNFHGLGSKAVKHEHYCKLDDVADKEGFIAVYPQSNHEGWNAGLGFKSYMNGDDDIGNLNKLLDTLESIYSIDKKRIYATGVSLGGSFTYRIACEMSDRIAAVASVSGLMSDSTLVHCNLKRNIPILHIHGTDDYVMHYSGMHQANGVEALLKIWTLKDQCVQKPDTIQIPNRDKTDHSTVQLIKYKECAGKSEVWFYKITNGGHAWPGGGNKFRILGRKNNDFNGSQAIWDFFKKFTLNTGK
jgi:polyhydroxybutyrate depolymerase